MIETDTVNILFLQNVKHIPNFTVILFIYSESESDTLPDGPTVSDALHGPFIRAVNSPEEIIGLLKSIQADAYISDSDVFYLLRSFPIDKRAIGRKCRPDASLCGMLRKSKKIFS